MCIGVPMQVIRSDGDGSYAVCESRGRQQRLDMLLIGTQPPGTWVLEFHGVARRVLSPDEAQQTLDALAALDAVLSGPAERATIDALFADLVAREPQLPEHLKGNA